MIFCVLSYPRCGACEFVRKLFFLFFKLPEGKNIGLTIFLSLSFPLSGFHFCSRWEMPPKHFCSCPEYRKTMTSSWQLSTPFLVSDVIIFPTFTAFICVKVCSNLTALLYPATGVLSVLGNGILLFVAYRKKSSLKPAEFFVVNLAISDLGMTITLFPLAIPSAYAHM